MPEYTVKIQNRYIHALYLSAGFGDFERLARGMRRSGWARVNCVFCEVGRKT